MTEHTSLSTQVDAESCPNASRAELLEDFTQCTQDTGRTHDHIRTAMQANSILTAKINELNIPRKPIGKLMDALKAEYMTVVLDASNTELPELRDRHIAFASFILTLASHVKTAAGTKPTDEIEQFTDDNPDITIC